MTFPFSSVLTFFFFNKQDRSYFLKSCILYITCIALCLFIACSVIHLGSLLLSSEHFFSSLFLVLFCKLSTKKTFLGEIFFSSQQGLCENTSIKFMFLFHSQPSPNIKEACVTFIRWLSAELCHACARSRTKEMQPAWRCLLICEINLEPVPSTLQNKLGCTPPSVCHNMRFKKLKPCLEFNADAADNERFGKQSSISIEVFFFFYAWKKSFPTVCPHSLVIFSVSWVHISFAGDLCPGPSRPLPCWEQQLMLTNRKQKCPEAHEKHNENIVPFSGFFFPHPLHLRLTLVI